MRIKIVKAVKVPERTDFPTPMTPPNAEMINVPSEVISVNLLCRVSIIPNWLFKFAIVELVSSSFSKFGALLISCVPCETTGGITTAIKKATKKITDIKIMATALVRDIPRF